jgi:histidine ammonia-lyase
VHREFTPEAVFPEVLDDHISRESSRLVDALHPLRCSVPESGATRGLQDPDVFCNLPHLLAALEEASAYARALVTIELDTSDSNPLVLPVARAPIAVAN